MGYDFPNVSLLSILLPCLFFLLIAGGVTVFAIYLLNKRKKEMAEQSPQSGVEAIPNASQVSESIVCPSCGAENPTENNFCEQCGAALGG